MFSKLIYILMIIAFSGTVLSAQTQTQRTKRQKKQSGQVQQNARQENSKNNQESNNTQTKNTPQKTVKKDPQQEIRRLMKIDPRFPELKGEQLKQQIDAIQKGFVKPVFPPTLQAKPSGDYPKSSMGLQIMAVKLKELISHPDLEEATGNRYSWYRKVGAELVALYTPRKHIERAIDTSDEKRYKVAVILYHQQAKVLGKILDKPEKIPSGELAKIKEVNTERRKQEIKKKINELMRQRRSGK